MLAAHHRRAAARVHRCIANVIGRRSAVGSLGSLRSFRSFRSFQPFRFAVDESIVEFFASR